MPSSLGAAKDFSATSFYGLWHMVSKQYDHETFRSMAHGHQKTVSFNVSGVLSNKSLNAISNNGRRRIVQKEFQCKTYLYPIVYAIQKTLIMKPSVTFNYMSIAILFSDTWNIDSFPCHIQWCTSEWCRMVPRSR